MHPDYGGRLVRFGVLTLSVQIEKAVVKLNGIILGSVSCYTSDTLSRGHSFACWGSVCNSIILEASL